MPRPVARLALTVALCAAAAAPAVALTPSKVLSHLNAQRAMNGMGPVAADGSLTDGCVKHTNYIRLNGGVLVHGEQAGRPGYTAIGAQAVPEVLSARAKDWDDKWATPWVDFPLHLVIMFNPRMNRAGYGELGKVSCMRFTKGGAPAGNLFSLPGNGATDVPTLQDASGEGPYSPADVAGLPDRTGFNILLWRMSGTLDVQAATLTGPSGPVQVKVVDPRTPVPGGGTFATWEASVVIPVQPLAPASSYTLNVTYADGTPYTASFTTGASNGPKLTVRVFRTAGRIFVLARSQTPGVVARGAVFRANGTRVPTRLSRGLWATGPLPRGQYKVCSVAGGPGTGFPVTQKCTGTRL